MNNLSNSGKTTSVHFMSYTHSDCTLFGIELPVWALCTDPFIIPNLYTAGNFCKKENMLFIVKTKRLKL